MDESKVMKSDVFGCQPDMQNYPSCVSQFAQLRDALAQYGACAPEVAVRLEPHLQRVSALYDMAVGCSGSTRTQIADLHIDMVAGLDIESPARIITRSMNEYYKWVKALEESQVAFVTTQFA